MINFSTRDVDTLRNSISDADYIVHTNSFNVKNAQDEIIGKIDRIMEEIYHARSEVNWDISQIGSCINHNNNELSKASSMMHSSNPADQVYGQTRYDTIKSVLNQLYDIRNKLERTAYNLKQSYDKYSNMRSSIMNRISNFESSTRNAEYFFKNITANCELANSIAKDVIELLSFEGSGYLSTSSRIMVSNINVFNNFASQLQHKKEKFEESKESMTYEAKRLNDNLQDEVSKACLEFASRSSVPRPLLDFFDEVSDRFNKVTKKLHTYLEIK